MSEHKSDPPRPRAPQIQYRCRHCGKIISVAGKWQLPRGGQCPARPDRDHVWQLTENGVRLLF